MDDVIFPRAVGLVLRLWDEISEAVYARLAKFRYFFASDLARGGVSARCEA